MERKLNLITSDIAAILGIGDCDVGELVRMHLLKPAISVNHARFWGAEDIFRGFAALVLVQEFEDRYGQGNYKKYKYAQVGSNLMVAVRKPERFLKTPEWKAVVGRARGRGISFAGSNLDYIEAQED